MRQLPVLILSSALVSAALFGQGRGPQIEGKEVAKNDDVVFRQIDEHTWVGSGHMMANESLYLIEGANKAVLIDAGTKIADLDKVAASITKKPIMLVATHAHPDHTGSAINYFPELYLNPGDAKSQFVAQYKGTLKDLKDEERIDLGGRSLLVVFTPGHTPGSTSFIDADAGYGFSGDSFGSGNLLLSGTFSTLAATCQKMSALMEKLGVKMLYPGHFMGRNPETKQRVDDEATISKDVISGKLKGNPNPGGMMGLNLIVTAFGVRINYSEANIQ
jgi:hydroxyacylglutathione hydrolase